MYSGGGPDTLDALGQLPEGLLGVGGAVFARPRCLSFSTMMTYYISLEGYITGM